MADGPGRDRHKERDIRYVEQKATVIGLYRTNVAGNDLPAHCGGQHHKSDEEGQTGNPKAAFCYSVRTQRFKAMCPPFEITSSHRACPEDSPSCVAAARTSTL